MLRIIIVTVFAFWASNASLAQRSDDALFVIGLGLDHALADIDLRPGTSQPYGSVEAATQVLVQRIDLRFRAGVDVSPYGVWGGVGPSLEFDVFDTPLFLEVSLMPGLWTDFDHQYRTGLFEKGLGHMVQFRTQVGVGWHLSDESALSASLSHKSNANIPGSMSNPGIEALQLRYGQSF